jgi:hypothetical protein
MSEQIYERLPRWRRIIRDLGAEAGIKKFVNSSDAHDKGSLVDSTSSKRNQPEAKR